MAPDNIKQWAYVTLRIVLLEATTKTIFNPEELLPIYNQLTYFRGVRDGRPTTRFTDTA